ncbi:MAG TPA: SIR2 family protein [bacterium]|nr:SIR2 family protein [bacterium]
MSNVQRFSDQRHVEQIRKRLWCGREFGQAAVMVGAGFSRNAARTSDRIPPCPLWGELASRFFDDLYPGDTIPEAKRKKLKSKAIKGSGALKLASEYEHTFGRAALDRLLQEEIRDTSYNPGHLHRLLLSLPWSDVFTTNYDTLLERASADIYDKKYDVVVCQEDIPGRMKPRIVKLHGSFPSHRPFIITQKDYHSYRRNCAPFVNMVQQSIMENVFCLIGFSGDDPNFQCWTDWVRENLGAHTPKIYLCGLLSLSARRRQELETKGIIPIDLSPIFPESEWHDVKIRHAKALEWFLLDLMYGKPPDVTTWPKPTPTSVWKRSESLPPVPPGPASLPDLGREDPERLSFESLDESKLKRLRESWERQRLKYPGWEIAPPENRDVIWEKTKYLIDPVLNSVARLPLPQNLFLLYELNWRLEKAFMPLVGHWHKKMLAVVRSFNPYPSLVELEGATIKPDMDEYRSLDWRLVGERWVKLAFALARKAREDLDQRSFDQWMGPLEKIVGRNKKWQARWFYEKALFHLSRLEQVEARKTIDEWPLVQDLPFWNVKRASILAELGELKDAKKVAQDSLNTIRSGLDAYSANYSLLSQEGWTMLLLRSIRRRELKSESDLEQVEKNRWVRLEEYSCNPLSQVKHLESELSGPPPQPSRYKQVKKDFDRGGVTVTNLAATGLSIFDFRQAFVCLRMLEESGCGHATLPSEMVIKACEWVAPFAPLLSLTSMIRSGNKKGIEDHFDRVRVATLSTDQVNVLNDMFTTGMGQAVGHLARNQHEINLWQTSFSQRLVDTLSVLLSRLCLRLSAEQLESLFDSAMRMYEHYLFAACYLFHESLGAIFRQLLSSMPESMTLERMPILLSLPIPTEMGFKVAMRERWVEPFDCIVWPEAMKLDTGFERSTWAAPIANLIRVVKDGAPEARTRAVCRLAKINEIEALTDEERASFAKALWSRTNAKSRLPSVRFFFDSAFLSLPEPKPGMAKERLSDHLLATTFPPVIARDDKGGIRMDFHLVEEKYAQEWLIATLPLFPSEQQEMRCIDWGAEEALALFQKVDSTWAGEKADFLNGQLIRDFKDRLRLRFDTLVTLMAEVVLPRLGSIDDSSMKDHALKMLDEMDRSGICVLSALSMTLFIERGLVDETASRLRVGLNSTKEKEVNDSISGLFFWLLHSERGSIPVPPADLLNDLINKIVARSQPGLLAALHTVSTIIRNLPALLNERQCGLLCAALGYLQEVTRLPNEAERQRVSILPTAIPIHDLPKYQGAAAKLAYGLQGLYRSRKMPIPDAVRNWHAMSKISPLPEVKRVLQQP